MQRFTSQCLQVTYNMLQDTGRVRAKTEISRQRLVVVPDRSAQYYCAHRRATQVICGACGQRLDKLQCWVEASAIVGGECAREVNADGRMGAGGWRQATHNLVLPRMATPATQEVNTSAFDSEMLLTMARKGGGEERVGGGPGP